MGIFNGNKIFEFLKTKLENMKQEELVEYLAKLGLELPAEGITDEFVNEVHDRVRSRSVSKPARKRFKAFGYGMRDLSVENHWVKDIKKTDFAIKRPVIICLPGNGSITREKANGFCKLIERSVGLNHEGDMEKQYTSYRFLDIIGCHYGTYEESNTAGTITQQEADEFFDRLFMPMCKDEMGNPLSLEEISKNFSLVTFATHCYGAVAVEIIMDTFDKKLTELGYSKEDIKHIKSHMCQVSYSPYTKKSAVPTIAIDSMSDSFHEGMDKQYEHLYGEKLDGIAIHYDQDGMYMNRPNPKEGSFETIHVFTSRLLNREDNRDLSKLIDEHTIEYIEREDNWSITDKAHNAKNADAVSLIMSYAVAWMLTKSYDSYREGVPVLRNHLNEELQPLLEDVAQVYSADELKM